MGMCAFCRKSFKKMTVDHVPPRGLFGKNPKCNLITVPSCQKCNNDTSKDDEYFRLLALEIGASETPVAPEVNESNVRAILHPKKKGFRESIFRTLRPVELLSPAGLFIANTFTVNMKIDRLLRTVEKTIRGLFFSIKDHPVPEDHDIWCCLMLTMPEVALSRFRELLPLFQPVQEIGEKVFRYRWGCQAECPETVVFQLGFYERFDFFGYTMPKAVKAELLAANAIKPGS
jgi:hypothetical protein